jgi:hypothetical protein
MSHPDTIAASPSFRQRYSAYLHERPRLRRELYLLGGALGVGLTALPLLIYLAGALTLGSYESGGLGSFLADFFLGLFRGWLPAWGVALGPLALVVFVRAARFIWRRFLTPAEPT